MNIFLDIDNTICRVDAAAGVDRYRNATPIQERIAHANDLYDKGNRITYWTARGKASGTDHSALTREQLATWGAKYHELRFDKPAYDLYVDDKSQHSEAYFQQITSRFTQPSKVPKGWGYELVITNTPKYCGKIMHFRKGAKFSMHFHIQKTETWYVYSGKFEFRYINTADATIQTRPLNVGDVVTNEIGQPHQIICLEEGDVFEVSTQHFDSDSYRVMPGDSQSTVSDTTLQCPCTIPNGLFLGHLGLGDQILLAPAMKAIASKCNTLYVICKDIYESALRTILASAENIVLVPIPNITDFAAEVQAINAAIGTLPAPLTQYFSGNFSSCPNPPSDFPLHFYKDLDLDWTKSKSEFVFPNTPKSQELAALLESIPHIFVHDNSSTKDIDLNDRIRKENPGRLVINPERNAYRPEEPEYRLAAKFIRTANDLNILDYKATIESAAQLHLIGSCFFAFAAMLTPIAFLKVVYCRDRARFPTLTVGTWLQVDI
jgi:mannose-6-phosphate isomerase-like protein (cupin superfamily)